MGVKEMTVSRLVMQFSFHTQGGDIFLGDVFFLTCSNWHHQTNNKNKLIFVKGLLDASTRYRFQKSRTGKEAEYTFDIYKIGSSKTLQVVAICLNKLLTRNVH